MALTATLVQVTLAIQVLAFMVLLLPIGTTKRKAALRVVRSKSAETFQRVILASYVMVFILCADSIYKVAYGDVVLQYLYKSNMYLTGFTLLNAVVLYRFVHVFSQFLEEAEKSRDLTRQGLAHKEFVDGLLADLDEKGAEITRLREDKCRLEALLRQHRNNESAFFELLEKYNALKYAQESRKSR